MKAIRKGGLGLCLFAAASLSVKVLGTPSIESSLPAMKQRTLSATLNAGELGAFGLGSAVLGVGYVPIHLDMNYLISRTWQVNLGLVFRYDWGSFIGPEFIGMIGARYSLSGSGLFGGFVSLKVGPGYVTGTNNTSLDPGLPPGTYSSFEFCAQPEAGYSYPVGSNGYLTLGGGILFIAASAQGTGWSPLGIIVHRVVPLVDIGLGMAF